MFQQASQGADGETEARGGGAPGRWALEQPSHGVGGARAGWGWGATAAAHRSGTHALQLVKQCNEGAHKMERMEQMYTLHTQLDFGKVKVGGPGRRPQALGPSPVWRPPSWPGPWRLGPRERVGGSAAASTCLPTAGPSSVRPWGWRGGRPLPPAGTQPPPCPPVPAAHLRLPLAAEARGALTGGRGRAFPEAGQPAHVLPVPVQRRPGRHQEEEVGPAGGCQAVWPCTGTGEQPDSGQEGLSFRGVGGTQREPRPSPACPGQRLGSPNTVTHTASRGASGCGLWSSPQTWACLPGHRDPAAHGLCSLGWRWGRSLGGVRLAARPPAAAGPGGAG